MSNLEGPDRKQRLLEVAEMLDKNRATFIPVQYVPNDEGGSDKRPAIEWRNGDVDYVTTNASEKGTMLTHARMWAKDTGLLPGRTTDGWALICREPSNGGVVVLDLEAHGMSAPNGLLAAYAATLQEQYPTSHQPTAHAPGLAFYFRASEAPTDYEWPTQLGYLEGKLQAEVLTGSHYAVVYGPNREYRDDLEITEIPFADLVDITNKLAAACKLDGGTKPEPVAKPERKSDGYTPDPDALPKTADIVFNATKAGMLLWDEDILPPSVWGEPWTIVEDTVNRKGEHRIGLRHPNTDKYESANVLDGVLHNHSTSVPLAIGRKQGHTPMSVIATLWFNDNMHAALKALEHIAEGNAPEKGRNYGPFASWPESVLELVRAAREAQTKDYKEKKSAEDRKPRGASKYKVSWGIPEGEDTEDIEWLLDKLLPTKGTVTLASKPGVGKSAFLTWISAYLSQGKLPGKYFGQARKKVICLGFEEDSRAHTMPRHLAEGGHNEDLGIIEIEGDSLETVNWVADAYILDEQLTAAKEAGDDVVMIAVDPIMSALDTNTDKDSAVREALKEIVKVAKKHEILLLLITHHNRNGSPNPSSNIMGSTAFEGLSRVTLHMFKLRGGVCYIGAHKTNIGADNSHVYEFWINKDVSYLSPKGVERKAVTWGWDLKKPIDKSIEDICGDWAAEQKPGGAATSITWTPLTPAEKRAKADEGIVDYVRALIKNSTEEHEEYGKWVLSREAQDGAVAAKLTTTSKPNEEVGNACKAVGIEHVRISGNRNIYYLNKQAQLREDM